MQAQSISLGQSIGLSGRGSESDLDTRLHSPAVNPRLEKRLKDFAEGGLCLLWKRQSMYAVAALGNKGGEHAATILLEEVRDVMAQLDLKTIEDVKQLNR